MTSDQTILFALFGAVFAMLLWGRVRYDLVAFAALLAAVVLKVIPPEDAFAGFGHPATVVVALVLVVSAGLVRSGAVFLITRTLVDSSRSLGAHIAFMGGIGGVLSAFMNNVAALALLMPVDIQTARKAGRPARLSLMPLSFCTILGGMVTLIGTPPNIIIAGIRRDQLGESFGMFDFAPVGGVVAIAGLAFVALIGWRLVPKAEGDGALSEAREHAKDYVAELKIPEGSDLAGTRLFEIYDVAEKNDVAIIGLTRDDKRRFGLQRNTLLREGDSIVLEARPEALDEFRAALSLDFTDADEKERIGLAGEGLAIIEAVVPESARIAGKTARALGLAWRRRTVLLGISREGRRITKEVRKTEVRPGDILLLLTPEGDEAMVTDWLGVLPLADRGLVVTDFAKVWLAIGIFAAAVAASALGLIYLPVALGMVVLAYVLTGVLPLSELYRHIEWPVVVLLGSMIPLGAALDASGGTALIAGALLGLGEGWPAWALLTLLMVVTMTLSDVLNNAATAVVAAPVGIQMATSLGVNPDPFLMAVAVAASCAFLTPIGHKNNTLILGPGGYSFGDYWRMGLPLELLVVVLAVPMILLVWPL
ncbi:SLC13 family permease [Tropicimonas sp. TH_r6]|uniref:SLC13 family permease n=1 Tax=Tropicimonas sp. TH_r6 TaxID=3082085 RepID=UPI002955A863|nr:SLC13 family permease [Tropicimonas sp. TH_r6]MDV7142719.1 SLC13 family permease [Tropicimonas sp. TH_r6]